MRERRRNNGTGRRGPCSCKMMHMQGRVCKQTPRIVPKQYGKICTDATPVWYALSLACPIVFLVTDFVAHIVVLLLCLLPAFLCPASSLHSLTSLHRLPLPLLLALLYPFLLLLLGFLLMSIPLLSLFFRLILNKATSLWSSRYRSLKLSFLRSCVLLRSATAFFAELSPFVWPLERVKACWGGRVLERNKDET